MASISGFVSKTCSLAIHASVIALKSALQTSQPQDCSCSVCKQSFLLKITEQFLSRRGSSVSKNHSDIPSEVFVSSLSDGSYEADLNSTISKIIIVLIRHFHFRATEFIQAVALFDSIIKCHWGCFVFTYLFHGSLKTMFLSCLILAHKCNSDIVYSNAEFARTFGVPVYTLNHFERSVLDLLSFNCTVPPELYNQFKELLFSPAAASPS